MARKRKRHDKKGKDTRKRKGGLRWRKNVLALLSIAYLTFLILFVVSVCVVKDPILVYDTIGVPFVALVGGTLTLAKDLIK